MRDYQQRVVMKDLKEFSVVYLVPLADWHIGCREVSFDKIKGYIDWIKKRPNAFTLLNGDMMNCAWKESTPELFEDLTTPDDAYNQLRTILEPIKDKILMVTRGGHEESIFRRVGADYMARLAYDLGELPYRPNGGMLGIRLGRNNHTAMFYAYAVHGWGGARTIGAKVKKAQDLMSVADVDCYILSHDHTQNVNRVNLLEPPRSRVSFKRANYMTIKRKLFINTGGFIKYSGYIQRKGYVPQDLGTPRIRIELKNTKEKSYHLDIHASI